MKPGAEHEAHARGVDREEFRAVAGHLASGVAVVTTTVGDARFGMTASSVTSLSLDPALMLVCINSTMPTAEAISASGVYTVNILDRDSAHLAQRFASRQKDKFAGLTLRTGVTGAPVLDGALAHIECRVVEQSTGGSHTIFIGSVEAAHARDGEPLTYFRGGFGRFELERDERAYLEIRGRLLQRQWLANSSLDVDQLAFELELDRSSCYYALTRLATERVLQREAGRGYVVVPFDLHTSDEAFDARSAIEIGVLELCLDRVPAERTAELRQLFERMADLLVGDYFIDFDRYLDANYAFHAAVVNLAGSPALSAAFDQIGLRAVMASSFGATADTSQQFIDVQREILEGIEAKDHSRAKKAVLTYSELAKHRVREILEHTGGLL